MGQRAQPGNSAVLEAGARQWIAAEGADMRGANLEGADLSVAGLYEADLREARLDGAHLHGAWYNDTTRWPANLDPVEEGAVFQY
jgi:uncharacterized protein YjbI with pentapeptide repeats